MKPLQQSALRLPQQDLETCSLFACEPDAVQAWVDELPLGDPGRAGSLLRTAVSEMNRVALASPLRFALMELIRPPMRTVIKALEQVCLNQPIVLDEEAQLRADIIADLCSLSSAGYTLVAVHTIRDSHSLVDVNPAKLAAESLHRATASSATRIRLSYLLYQPIELNTWANLHQLFALAERQQLARLPIEDELRDTRTSIAQEYVPPLLLACSKPNQLRQHDIMGAFRAFREWCGFVELQDPELGEGLFAVDMQSDQPPIFSELLVRRGTSQYRFLNTKALIAHLESLRHSRGTQGLRVIEFDRQTRLDTNLLEHLIKSLGEISQRNFARQPSRTTLDIAAGLSNVHYYVAGERTLDDVFHGVEYDAPASERLSANPFLVQDQRADQWRQVNPEADLDVDVARRSDESHVPVDIERLTHAATQQDRDSREPTRYVVHSVKTMNASAGGYCVEWDEPPDSIHIGDIVCVREADNQRANWTIAVIRWVSQIKHAPTLLGLELISPRGTAYAARIKMHTGEYSRPIRVILLPEIALVGQSHTLILPRLVFKEGQRITLSREEDAFLVKLKRQVASTGYFSQMDFDYLRQLDEDIAASRGDSLPTAVFDSIWSEL
ncbi:MAG: GTPase [Pseudomonadota bacterium]